MTEEEYFRNNYPDFCYGDRPLSPHWDFFQDGVEFGERQSEKKIADLEKENAELKKKYEDSLVACGVLKAKVDTLAQPSPLESMQDALIATQKIASEKQKEQLTKAKELIKTLLLIADNKVSQMEFQLCVADAKQFLNSEVEK